MPGTAPESIKILDQPLTSASAGANDQRMVVADHRPPPRPSNEYVLNVAFVSFLGFMLVQAVFALIAHSEAMLADSEAMMVDALTYLFNLCAERIKNRPLTDDERQMDPRHVQYRREMLRLYLELIPPALSVATLIAVTVLTLREATNTLKRSHEADASGGGDNEEEDNVSLPIMLIFSGANLLLDFVNVTCFARADMNFGLDVVRREQFSIKESFRETFGSPPTVSSSRRPTTEATSLLSNRTDLDYELGLSHVASRDRVSSSDLYPDKPHEIVNLNMCSAWTHVCADTLRSAAVLLAAGVASLVPSINPATADAVAAVAVSVIILGSLLPLLQGLALTAMAVHSLSRQPPITQNKPP